MLERTFLLLIAPLCICTKVYSGYAEIKEYPKELQRYFFRSIEAINSQPIVISGDIKQYGLVDDDISDCIDARFNQFGLPPDVGVEDAWDHYPGPADLVVEIAQEGKTVVIEVSLLVDAYLIKSHICISKAVWKEQAILEEESTPDMKNAILFYVTKLVDLLLTTYLDAKDATISY